MSFGRRTAISRARTSIHAEGTVADPESFLADVVEITGLICEEEGLYAFVHKSVAEYHAALCVRGSEEESAARFYQLLLASPSDSSFWGILYFLKRLDSNRFQKHFWAPLLRYILAPPPAPPGANLPPPRSLEDGYQKLFGPVRVLSDRLDLLNAGLPIGEDSLLRLSAKLCDSFRDLQGALVEIDPDLQMRLRRRTETHLSPWYAELRAAERRVQERLRVISRRQDVLFGE